jgi:uncharacterized protein (DUF2235 family)
MPPGAAGKNIVVCSDGTGNTAIKGRGTNVFKLFEAVDLNRHRTDPTLPPQVAIYDDGVGTEDFKPVRILAGATGYGLSRNVRQLYKELVRIYDPADRIFLFGFSRGAFTVRTLAGLIGFCGIVDVRRLDTVEALTATVARAYRAYRRRYRTPLVKLVRGDVDPGEIERFRAECCLEPPPAIHFVGVWDTVDAVGLPFHLAELINRTVYRFKFPDLHLGPVVRAACHALAVDDERHSFHPLLWHHRGGDDRRIDQTWFAGAHSNVGGGYPKQGVSLVALEWMLEKAEQAGLRLVPGDREYYRDHANVDDKVYDPRAGLGVFYRWKPRDMAALCAANRVAPTVHLSVLERIAHGTEDYAPGNLAPDARVVITPSGDAGADAAALARARAVEAVLHEAHRTDPRPLLGRVRGWIAVGHLSYYVYLATCLAVVAAASAPEDLSASGWAWRWLRGAVDLVVNVVTLRVGELWTALTRLVTSPWLLLGLVSGFVLSYGLTFLADRRMSAVFSRFWYEQQPRLRDALKAARREAAGRRPGGGGA